MTEPAMGSEVAIFWDYENCPVPSGSSGYAAVDKICSVARPYGSIKSFKAYLQISDQAQKALNLRSELQSSGVSLIDCPHNGRKDVADKMMMVDMLAHAIDTPSPSTVLLITGDRDFAYAISILRHRRYQMVLITLSNAHASLRLQAPVCLEWTDVLLAPMAAPMNAPSKLVQREILPALAEMSSPIEKPQHVWSEVLGEEESGLSQLAGTAPDERLGWPSPLRWGSIKNWSASGDAEQIMSPALAPIRLPEGVGVCFTPILAGKSTIESAGDSKISLGSTALTPYSIRAPTESSTMGARRQNSNPCDVSHVDESTLKIAEGHGGLFDQPFLSRTFLSVETVQPGSTPAPAIFLPSILTGASYRTRTVKAATLAVEPSQPSLISTVQSSLVGHCESNALSSTARTTLTSAVVSKPTLAPPIMVTIAPELVSPINKPIPSTGREEASLLPVVMWNSDNSSYTFARGTDATSSCTASPFPMPEAFAADNVKLELITPAIEEISGPQKISPESLTDAQSSSPFNTGTVAVLLSHRLSMPNLGGTASSFWDEVQSPNEDRPCSSAPSSISQSQSEDSLVSPGYHDEAIPLVPLPELVFSAADTSATPISLPPTEGLSEVPIPPPVPMNVSCDSAGVASGQLPHPAVVVTLHRIFEPLIQCLQAHRSRYTLQPYQVMVAKELNDIKAAYAKANAATFEDYAALAELQGIVELGGNGQEAWIRLSSKWANYDATPSGSSSSSATTATITSTVASPALHPRRDLSSSGANIDNQSPPIPVIPPSDPWTGWSPANFYAELAKITPGSSVPVAANQPQLKAPSSPTLIPDNFKVLVKCLEEYRAQGVLRPYRTYVAMELNKNKATYRKAGVARFGPYVALAEAQGIVELGHDPEGEAWIALKPDWYPPLSPE